MMNPKDTVSRCGLHCMIQNTDNWQTLVNVIMNIQLHKRQGIYRVSFSRWILSHGNNSLISEAGSTPTFTGWLSSYQQMLSAVTGHLEKVRDA